MKRIVFVGLGLMLGGPLLLAQAQNQGAKIGDATVLSDTVTANGNRIIQLSGPLVPLCPVAMSAKQGSGGGLLATRNAPPVSGPAQRIHLQVADSKAGKAASARIRVYGMSGKGRMQNADSEPKPDFVRTMDVTFAPEDKGAAADLVLRGYTAVSKIVLQTITYEDGSTWSPTRVQMCSVAPDPFMLVAGR